MPIGEADYRRGARDRLGEAYVLLRHDAFGGGVYPAGRGAEGALRAVLWKTDVDVRRGRKSLDTGHGLRQLLTNVRNLVLLHAGGRLDPLTADVQHVARLWYSNMRFASAGPKVSGSIVSSTFHGLRDSDRQRLLWDALDAEYGPESVRRVGSLLAFTPDEWDVDRE